MRESAFKIFLRGSLISLLGTGLLGILNYFVRRTLCVNLLSADYGFFYSSFALFSVIYSFGGLGLSQAATTLIARYSGTEKQHCSFNAFGIFRLLLTLITTVLICTFALPLSRSYLKSANYILILLFAILFFFQSVSGCFHSLYNGRKEFGTLQFIQIIEAIFLLAGMLFFGKTLQGAILCFAGASGIITIGNLIFCLVYRKVDFTCRPLKEDWIELFSLGGWLALSTTLFSSLYYMDTVMLTFQKGVESTAIYNVALPIMQIVQATMVFPAVMLPVAMDMSKEKNYTGLKRFALYGFLITLVLAPMCYFFFVWSGRWLICFLFTEKYVAATSAVPILCTALLFFTLGHFLLQILISLDQIKTVVLIAVICFLSNVFLNYFLIQKYDFTGASIATLCSYAVFMLLAFTCVLRIIRKLQ